MRRSTLATRPFVAAAAGILLVLLLVCTISSPARGAVWTLDGFGIYNGGTVAIDGSVHAIAVQRQDAKIVIGGDFTLTGGSPLVTRTNIARINPDGTLDTSFDPPLLNGPVHAIALQPDLVTPANPDGVLIGGSFTAIGGTDRKGLARLFGVDGSLDGFDPVTTTLAVTVNAITMLPGGAAILVGGEFREIKDGVPTRNLAGLSVAGAGSATLNWSYSGGLNDDGSNVTVQAVQLQNDAIIVAGEFTTPWSANIARFSAAGAYDATFRPPSPNGAVRALAVQADGKILLGGGFSGGLLSRDYLARLNADGTLDGFDPGFDTAAGSRVASISVEPDGRILAAGGFTIGPAPAQRRNLARLKIDGTLAETLFPAADAAVRALARQQDAKILAAGDFGNIGATPRSSLARFYPHGALDDDVPQVVDDPDGMVTRLSLHPDGSVTMGGLFEQVLGEPRFHITRVREDWSLDPGFAPGLRVGQRPLCFAPLPDQGLLVGGNFLTINGLPQRQLVQLDQAGIPGPAAFNAAVSSVLQMFGYVLTIALPGDGMIYVGGDNRVASPYRYMARFKSTGERDATFLPDPEVDGAVTSIVLLPDNLLLVTTGTGKLMKLRSDGSLDPAWHGGTPLQLENRIEQVALLPDGRILVGGTPMYPHPILDPDTGAVLVPPSRNLLRIGSDGSVDESFVIEARFTYDPSYGDYLAGFALQTDGNIIIYGVFDEVRDGFGTVINHDYVARVTPDGHLDTGFDLGAFGFSSTPIGQVNTVNLQPDGKFLVAGDFVGHNGRDKLLRFANGWSSEELSVSATGDSVTWLRSGTSPELWRVSFDYSENPDAATPVWVPLGNAHRVAGGWRLDGLDLARFGTGANRYLRARGSVAADLGSTGSLVESVRLYYLKPLKTTITVTAHAQSKTYGEGDPVLSYSFEPPLNGSDQFTGTLSRAAGEDVGVYAITRGTLALGSAYELAYNGAGLTIGEAPLLISADNQTKTAGLANPQLSASFAGLAPRDTPASLNGAPLLSTAVDAGTPRGSYPIRAALGSISNPNYRYSFAEGTFTVTGRPQGITLNEPPPKSYGDPPFAAGATAGGGLTVSYASSNPAVGPVVNGEIRITGAGSTVITASQGGDGFWDPAPDVSVNLTVSKATLRVVAEDKSRAYLTPNPELTAVYQGFVNGEGGSVLAGVPSLTTAATLSSAAGSYPIVAGAGTLKCANYDLVPVNGTLNVFKSCQEITFPAIPERTFGDPLFEIIASACSGLPLNFRSSDPNVARVDGGVITITGAGSAVISAFQVGTGDLETAQEKSQTLIVHRSGQEVSFSSPAQKVLGDPPFVLEAAATSGLPVSYLSSDPAVARVEGSTVTIVGAGTAVISALQEGNANYLSALPVSRTLTVAQEGVAPELRLSTLNPGASTSNPVLNLMGRATDLSGIASLTVQGRDRSADAALFSSAVVLSEGDNAISVTARDGAGNLTTHTFNITLDPLAPTVTLAAPADNSVTVSAACGISGTVTPGSSLTMAVNGAALQTLAVSGGDFSGTGYLAEGINTIELTAELEGRSSRIKRSVTFAPAGPALAITEPVQDVRTEAESVVLRGRSGSLETGSVLVKAGGGTLVSELADGDFRQQVALALGENRITVQATAADGATSVAQRNLVRIERIAGDLDGNGSADIQDAARLLRISLGAEPADAQALTHGDVAPLVHGVPQPDGVIDVGDLLVLLRKIVGLVHF